ncbi:MAG: hypothetical protein AAB466_15160 [Verrucomicrobiota bacterium]
MKLQRFNTDGVSAFSTYRARLALEPTLPPPLELLQDPALIELLPGEVDVPTRKFTNRLEAGCFLNELIDAAKVQLPERDQGLWTWLTLFYFDEVCPADGNGRRNPKDEARLIPLLDNHQRFYRHLLVGPFLIVRAHRTQPERAIAMLCNPLWEPGDIAEQLASRKELVTNHAVADVATRLYYDPATGSFKRGASSKVKGAARRLATLFNQLDLTFYLYGMSCDELLALLPKEFDRFRKPVG